MKNLKISTRLAAAFGFILFLALILALIGIWNAFNAQSIAAEVGQRQQASQLMDQWTRDVDVRANQVMAYALASDPKMIGYFKQGIDGATARIADYTRQADALFTVPESRRLFQHIMDQRASYLNTLDTIYKALDARQATAALDVVRERLPEINRTYLASIEALRSYQQEQVDHAQRRAADQAVLSERILALATILALILGPLFAWRVMRAITGPLRRAVAAAEAIAQRDLSHEIHVDSANEIGQLLSALATMTRNLRGAMTEVRTGSDAIASASSQISAGNLDLSSRTEQQASSLAETAATMEEITATVRQNADNAQQANTLAASAAKTATDGGAIVAELVSTMSEINTKSQQVADIIGVIDSIAFQTNILALNAAVEAARAGEQGRGFAVVASEVRALAQRSAGAAKEIKGLIDTSVESTAKGNEQASRAGATMQDIVDSINRVTDIMGEISAASREQTTGIEEINAAVTQMDDVTRQNASLVEESAAAASSLQEQADTLAHLVATFTLSQSDAAGAQGGAHARARTGAQAGAQAGARAAQAEAAAAGAGAARAAQPARIPSAPEKVVSPAPHRPRHDAPADAPAPRAAAKPALRAPGKPAPASADTEEWTEF
ncbi:methyl-accepting chemotaxis protein [Castellaniella defragrans]|uniref:Methyl-accepting chemotaxis protein n=1 Tax=Castellaniella defragrans TaxID=75697 RepID=A0A7W9WPJ9_CASDE|nr:methyl-accepting chemotaxis protein [Castellaniella defragrans]MBB6084544.1 methyl-accepting chemotaxis protein [Castellaniella defragrans]